MSTPLKQKHNPEISRIKRKQAASFRRNVARSIGNLNEELVRGYINNQSTGDFSGVSILAKKMQTDGIYSAALTKRVEALLRAEFKLLPADANESESTQYVADSLLKVWFEYIPELTIVNLLESYLAVGVGLAYVTWYNQEGVWLPQFEVCDTEFLTYDQNQQKWLFQASSGRIEINPGDGNWVMLTNWLPGQIRGFAAQLGLSYLSKQFALKDWADGNSSHAERITVIQQVEDAVQDDDSDIEDIVAEAQASKLDRVLYVGKDKSVTFEDSVSGYDASAFSSLVDQTDKTYQQVILGQNLTSEVNGGSYAATQIHAGVELNKIKGDASILSTVLYNQFLIFWVDDNFGNYKELTPWPTWNLEDPEDLGELIGSYTAVDALCKSNGYIVENLPELLEKFGFVVIRPAK